ncbi:MAG TPA: hypothetical protein VK464_27850 [Symbiobacteriaceae bacterium]|nr:hypothetical protein [Symbiobacteriaceae bacterium]
MPNHNLIPRLRASPVGVSYLVRRSPWIPVWWSVILPGFGHIYLSQNLKGLMLMSWEILVNNQSHLNLGIYYTVLGDIDKAAAVVDYRWLILYPLFYIFAMVDSYRVGVEYNQMASLERMQKQRRFDRVSISPLGIQAADLRNPALGAFWSAVMPGLGHMYSNRMIKSFVLTGWYLAVVLKSGLTLAAFHTLLGHFELAKTFIDYQWLLFWPSIYIFGIVDAYSDVCEQNLLCAMAFKYRLRKYLRNEGVH